MQVLSEETPTARKAHRCDACIGTIGAGDTYYKQTNTDMGLSTWKAHALCNAIATKMHRDYCADGWWEDEMDVDPWEVQRTINEIFAALVGRTYTEAE